MIKNVYIENCGLIQTIINLKIVKNYNLLYL